MRFMLLVLILMVSATAWAEDFEYTYKPHAQVKGYGMKPLSQTMVNAQLTATEEQLRACYVKQATKNADIHYKEMLRIKLAYREGFLQVNGRAPGYRELDTALLECVREVITAWDVKKMTGRVELRLAFVPKQEPKLKQPLPVRVSIGDPEAWNKNHPVEEPFLNVFEYRVGDLAKWKACIKYIENPNFRGHAKLYLDVDAYGFVLRTETDLRGIQPDNALRECINKTFKAMFKGPMPPSEGKIGYAVKGKVFFAREMPVDIKLRFIGPPSSARDMPGDIQFGSMGLGSRPRQLVSGSGWSIDPAGHVLVNKGNQRYEVSVTGNVCSTMLAARKFNRASDFRYTGRPCARLSGCLPGYEKELDRFSGIHNIPRFIQDVPEARAALKGVDENDKKALTHAANAFVLNQIKAEISRVQKGARVCKEDVCKEALEKMNTQCAPLLQLEVVKPR